MPSVPIGVYALRYWSGDPALLPYELRVNLLHNPPAFILHNSFGGLAVQLQRCTRTLFGLKERAG